MTKTYIQNNNLKAQDKLKLSIKFFILSAFFMISIVTVSYNHFINGILNNTMGYNMEVVQNVSASIDDYLSNIEKDLKVLSISKEIQNIAVGEEIETIENLLKRFEEYSTVHDEVKNIYFETINKKIYTYPYANIPEGYDGTETSWYLEAVNTRDYVWSDNYTDMATGDILKSVSIAIFKNDKLIGVIGIDMDLSIIEEKLKNIYFGKTDYMMLLDRQGKALIHPSKEVIGKTLEIDELKEVLNKKYEMTSFSYQWHGTEKVMFCSKTNKGNFIVVESVEKKELVENNEDLLILLILLCIISTIILTFCSLVISIGYSKKQEVYVDKQPVVKDNYKKSDDLKDKLDKLKDYKSNGTLTNEEYEIKREHIIKDYDI